MPDDKTIYAKSPLNYTGGKHKILKYIIPLVPTDNDMVFIDLFGGGGNVCANAPENYSKVVYNDINDKVLELVKYLVNTPTESVVSHIENRIMKFGLSRIGKDEYMSFRAFYNAQPEPRNIGDLFTLIAHSFSNQIRFNRKGEFNLPFGKRTFNDSMRSNMFDFVRTWNMVSDKSNTDKKRKTEFTNKSFDEFDFAEYLPDTTFVYCDPPYLGSVATYNENGGWTKQDEEKLLQKLDELNKIGYKWMLSNNLEYDNPILKEWINKNADKYTVIDIKHDYKNCNYHKNLALRSGETNNNNDNSNLKEIVVINYNPV